MFFLARGVGLRWVNKTNRGLRLGIHSTGNSVLKFSHHICSSELMVLEFRQGELGHSCRERGTNMAQVHFSFVLLFSLDAAGKPQQPPPCNRRWIFPLSVRRGC